MRARESFELIRNKKIKLSLRTRMTLYVLSMCSGLPFWLFGVPRHFGALVSFLSSASEYVRVGFQNAKRGIEKSSLHIIFCLRNIAINLVRR